MSNRYSRYLTPKTVPIARPTGFKRKPLHRHLISHANNFLFRLFFQFSGKSLSGPLQVTA